MIDRRSLLGLGTAAALGPGLPALEAAATNPATPGIRRHVTLGRTGLEVSDIGFGSASSHDPDLVRHALDRGVTFFDTAESYRFGWSEEAMGDGLRGVRDRVVLSSKTKVGARDTQEEVMAALEGSLRRLRTDYLDIYFNHAVNNVARLQNPEWRAFTERAKEQGKIRFAACPDTAAGLRNAWSTRSTMIWSTSCWSPTASARTPISTTACATPSISWPCSRSCPARSTRPRRKISASLR